MNTTTILIIVGVILVLISSSVGAYFMMSGSEETSSTPVSSNNTTSSPSSTPPPSTPPPSTPPPASVGANPGEAISCNGYNPKGAGAIYRYDGDRKMRHYPNPDIADSWDPNWPSGVGRQIDCTGFTLGDDIQFNPNACNKNVCNAVMQDWIVNKYWAFGDTAKNFGECKNCQSRWFKAPFRTSNDGNNWKDNANRNAAYDAVKL